MNIFSLKNLFVLFLIIPLLLLKVKVWAKENPLIIKGFSDISYLQNDAKAKGNFSLGDISLFMTKKLDRRTNFLLELVFDINENNRALVDPARLWISYYISSWIAIKAGKVHAPLGYWGRNYHTGRYLYTSISSPILYLPENEGGILPIHATGLELNGYIPFPGIGVVGYTFCFSNGRGADRSIPLIKNDSNKFKAINFLLFYEFPFGLQSGVSFYHDYFSGENDTPPRGDETIWGTYLVYEYLGWEFVGELFFLDHAYKDSISKSKSLGYYTQFAYQWFSSFMPYFRFEYLKTDNYNTYLQLDHDTTKKYVTGIRYDFSARTALKFEYDYKDPKYAGKERVYEINWSFTW